MVKKIQLYRAGNKRSERFPTCTFVPFLKDGYIEEMFAHRDLSSLFIPGFYEPYSHAIKLLCYTFNIAPL